MSTRQDDSYADEQTLDEFTQIFFDEKALAKLDKFELSSTDATAPPQLCSCSPDARTDATSTGGPGLSSTRLQPTQESDDDFPTIFVITPTYARSVQAVTPTLEIYVF